MAALPMATQGNSPYLDQDLVNLMLSSYTDKPQSEQFGRQQEMADALRGGSMRSPQGIQAGRVYVAPSWASVPARALQAYAGGKMGAQAQAGQEKLAGGMSDRAKQYLDALYGNRGQQEQDALNTAYGG